MKNNRPIQLPSIEELEAEIYRQKHRQTQHHLLRNALYALITVAAVTALIAILFMPVLKTYGTSMTPTLEEGEIVVAIKTSTASQGDVIAFYYNNKIFIKRVIALGGAEVDIDEEGFVYVDGERLDEPYVTERAIGNGDVEFPFQVPDGQYFVLGDNRMASADSRSTTLGCVEPDDMLGRVLFCIWPLNRLHVIH
jgi:signal peptidase I, bacterial type